MFLGRVNRRVSGAEEEQSRTSSARSEVEQQGVWSTMFGRLSGRQQANSCRARVNLAIVLSRFYHCHENPQPRAISMDVMLIKRNVK